MATSGADDKRFYVLTLRGDLGPFDRATLAEKLQEGSIRPHDQVRNAFGRVQGTVAEALDLRRERTSAPARRPGEAARSGPHRPAAGAARGGSRWLLPAIIVALLVVVAAFAVIGRSPPPELARPAVPMVPKPLPVSRPTAPATPQLVIRKAVYGAPAGPGADVTQTVAAAVQGGRLTIRAENSRFGDPALGKVKQLRVDYLWNGEERSRTVPEESVLTISDQGR